MSDKKESLLLRLVKYVLPILVIFAAFGIILAAFIFKPEPERKETVQVLPVVEIVEAESKPITLGAPAKVLWSHERKPCLLPKLQAAFSLFPIPFSLEGTSRKVTPLLR